MGENLPIYKRWSRYTKDKVRELEDYYGVYELANSSREVVYIGEGRIRSRLLSHFADGQDPTPGVSYFRYELTGSKLRATQRQNALLAEFEREYGRLPKYNQRGRN
jgi:excinuclease UvrABC nuclease subunit